MSDYLPSNSKFVKVIEKVNIKNLLALCYSQKLQDWDNTNFPKEKEKEKNNTTDVLPSPLGKEFVRHHINSIRQFAEMAIPMNGNIEITYTYDNYGRLKNINPYNKSYSYTNMYSEIRNLLASDYYVDIDIVNCHYTIFYNECIINNIPSPKLEKYINNRDAIFKKIIELNPEMKDKETKEMIEYMDYPEQKKILKGIFTALLNNGYLQKQVSDYNITNADFLEELFNELQINIKKIVNLDKNKDESDYIRKKKHRENDISNILGSQISSILQTLERKILFALVDAIEDTKYNVGARIHDGCHVEKTDRLLSRLNLLLQKWSSQINRVIYNNIRLPIKKLELVSKDMVIDESFLIPDSERIKYLYQKNILENVWGLAKINNTGEYISFERPRTNKNEKQLPIKYYNVSELQDFFRNKCLIDGKPSIVQWLADSYIKSYDKIEFNPNPKCKNDGSIYNTFTGFTIDDYKYNDLPKTQIEREKEIIPLLELMKLISGNNKKQYITFMHFTSHILVKPYIKVKICPILKGLCQGVGKNTYILLMKNIIGERYVLSTPDIKKLFDKFNIARQDKLLICINEANFQDTSKFMGMFKDAITESKYFQERKGVDAIEVYSYENFMGASNAFYPFDVENGNRRLFVVKLDDIDMSPEEKKQLFDNIYANFLGYGDIKPNYRKLRIFFEYMHEWFRENEVDKYSFEQNVETEESKILKHTEPLDDWIQIYIIPKIQENNYLQSLEVSPTELMNSYIDYCKKCNFSYNNVNKLWASKHIYSRFYKFAEQSKSHAMGRKVCFDINNFLKFFNISREDINDIVIDE
jgi:hypothetical protein